MVEYVKEEFLFINEAFKQLLANPMTFVQTLMEIDKVLNSLKASGCDRAGLLLSAACSDLGLLGQKKFTIAENIFSGQRKEAFFLIHFVELTQEDIDRCGRTDLKLKTYIVGKLAEELEGVTLSSLATQCNNRTVKVCEMSKGRYLTALRLSKDDFAIAKGVLAQIDPEEKKWSVSDESDEI